MSESEDLSFHSVAMPSESFKSRFLKTDKSKALLQEQATTVPLVPTNIAPLPGSLRGMRSTFSPTKLSKLPENVEVKPNADNLSKNIKDFINRTDHVSSDWKTLGQNSSRGNSVRPPQRRDSSMDRERGIRGLSPMASDYSVFCTSYYILSLIFEIQFLNSIEDVTNGRSLLAPDI